MTTSLTLPRNAHTHALLAFRDTSPLAGCTTAGYDGGALVVRTDRPLPLLSDGERELWALFTLLATGTLLARAEVTGPLGVLATQVGQVAA